MSPGLPVRGSSAEFFRIVTKVVLRVLFLVVKQCVRLSLTLLVTQVFANNHDATLAANDFAFIANLLDAWINLHVYCSPCYL